MVFPLIWFLFRGEWLWVLVSRVPQEYLRLIVPNSWRTDVAVRARTEMVRWIRVNQLNKRRKKEIEQGWDAASSPSLTTTRSLCQIAVRSMRMIAREPESTPPPDMTSPGTTSKIPSVWRVRWSVSTSRWLQRRLEIPKLSLHLWGSRNPCSMIYFFQKSPPWSCCLFIRKESFICCHCCGFRALPKHQEGNLLTAYFP